MTAERFAAIQQRIAAACQRCNRSPDEVTLVGAAKRQPLETIRAVCQAGVKVIGENRVQEAEEKQPHLPELDWHLIGPLQSNKAKKAARLFSTVHSIDRPKIARALAREAAALDRELQGFLEVNVGREQSKHGFDPSEVVAQARVLAELESLRIVGVMAIPPYESDPEAARAWFRRLRELRDELCSTAELAECPGWLSMGMSSDFEVAIEEGATHVRVGTALFGPRPQA
jgi:pyridoxal phosphate enzyme (YggS family)